MKREIKFRGWFQQHDGQEFWVYGYFYIDEIGNSYITDGMTHWCVYEDSVGQSVGLNFHGVDVYDGDVIEWEDTTSNYPNVIKGKATIKIIHAFKTEPSMLFCGEDYKVVGNIHENQELVS
ncbi:MAG: hypothetical protein COB15_09615 [Flavobacteriales bacterium]|nr:MAG: hypothetical protein COB15_09615 [Flavobacteriales bacterium]